jgi:hypothetical protein
VDFECLVAAIGRPGAMTGANKKKKMNANLKITAEMRARKKETTACLGKASNQGKPKVRLALKEASSHTGDCEVSSVCWCCRSTTHFRIFSPHKKKEQ